MSTFITRASSINRALDQIGDKWCDERGSGRPVRLLHQACGASLRGEVRCDACGGVLQAREVEFAL